ncbi:MAG TPA: hypothetical protein PLB27_14685 [Bacteroidales bacterium]|nr:hypothetical protein [Bacteroidales bacterium]
MLSELIHKNKQNITTLIVIYVVLDNYLTSKNERRALQGLTAPEIDRKYREVAERFSRRERFSKTYLQRHAGSKGFVVERDGRYLMREAMVNDTSIENLQVLRQSISEILIEQNLIYQNLFGESEERLAENDQEKSKDFILSLFNEKRFRNFGQIFEVLSYSILKVYFESFGFGLKRLSVAFSNDSGMDFLSSNGVYQVTSSPTKIKVQTDLDKLPGISRVMVLSHCPGGIRDLCLNSEIVTEVITADDLKSHFLAWLYERDTQYPRFMRCIISTFRDEMIRETT